MLSDQINVIQTQCQTQECPFQPILKTGMQGIWRLAFSLRQGLFHMASSVMTLGPAPQAVFKTRDLNMQ